jgi:hypothetical protein
MKMMLSCPQELGYYTFAGPAYVTVFHQTSTGFSTLAAKDTSFWKYWQVKGFANPSVSSFLVSGYTWKEAMEMY